MEINDILNGFNNNCESDCDDCYSNDDVCDYDYDYEDDNCNNCDPCNLDYDYNCNDSCDCGSGFGNNNLWIIIILLLLCGGNRNGGNENMSNCCCCCEKPRFKKCKQTVYYPENCAAMQAYGNQGYGNGGFESCGGGFGSWWIIILILLFCGGFNNGCGNNCGC